jgi:hypothetical protein
MKTLFQCLMFLSLSLSFMPAAEAEDPIFDWIGQSHLQFLVVNIGKHSASTYFGYGFLGTSELDSERALRGLCEAGAQGEDGSIDDLRAETFKYLRLQQLALGSSARSRLSCLEDNIRGIRAGEHLMPVSISRQEDAQLRTDQIKYSSTYIQLGINFTIRSLFWHDFASKRIDFYCSPANINNHRRLCLREREYLRRIIISQPMLFADYNRRQLRELRFQLYELLEAHQPGIKGEEQYQNGLKWIGADSFNTDRLVRSMNDALRAFHNPETRGMVLKISETYQTMRQNHLTFLEGAMAGLCEDNLEDLISKYPAAARQYVFDSKMERQDVSGLLCSSPEFRKLQASTFEEDQVRCVDYRVLNQNGSQVLSFNNAYSLARQQDRIVVEGSIAIVPGPELNNEQVSERLRFWEKRLNSYYNCQTGLQKRYEHDGLSFTCPNNYRELTGKEVEFKISFFIPGPSHPRFAHAIKLHRCFDHDAPDKSRSSDCAYLREWRISNCIKDGQSRSRCENDYPVENVNLYAGRVNSSNYMLTSNMKTIAHEVGHFFRLKDEYNVGHFWNPQLLGGYPSIMASVSFGLDELRLMERHIDQIIAPLSCLAGQSPRKEERVVQPPSEEKKENSGKQEAGERRRPRFNLGGLLELVEKEE